MTIPRSKLVDLSVTRWYHCISCCVRRAHLLGEGVAGSRKAWLEERLRFLAEIFAVSVGGFSMLDNHMHLLLRLDPEVANGWTDEEVIIRWFKLYPPRGSNRKPLPPPKLQKLIEELLQDPEWLAETRKRLGSLSWFHKCLKEPFSRMVNEAENCRGTFFEGRFKSIAILDEESLLSVNAYIDLNPVAAGMVPTPEQSKFTSVKARIDHVQQCGRTDDLQAARGGSVAGSHAAKDLEEALWLIPIEDRRRIDSSREGMLEGFTLGNYLMLVEYTGRMFREGKAAISAEVTDIFARLGSSAELWQERLEALRRDQWLGYVLASSREKLDHAAQQFGLTRLVNLSNAPVH